MNAEVQVQMDDGIEGDVDWESSPVVFTDEWMDPWQYSEWYWSIDRSCDVINVPSRSCLSAMSGSCTVCTVCVFCPSHIVSCVTNAVLHAFWLVPLLGFNKSLANIEMALPALSLGCRDALCAAFWSRKMFYHILRLFWRKKKIRDVQEQRNRGLSEIESTMRSVSNCILVPLCPSLYELQSCTCQFVGDASGMWIQKNEWATLLVVCSLFTKWNTIFVCNCCFFLYVFVTQCQIGEW